MNKLRRKHIDSIMDRISGLQASVDELLEELNRVRDDENEAFENIPESLEGSDRYNAAEAAVENLDEAVDSMEEVSSTLEEIFSSLESAKE